MSSYTVDKGPLVPALNIYKRQTSNIKYTSLKIRKRSYISEFHSQLVLNWAIIGSAVLNYGTVHHNL